ncbi:hypothetical protein EV421DRAFT_1913374 [Armillaria borealis]|uniref:Uncharacterized protein n=1 Tax=Armillaria borealis TaxID=47425 RepID=A0AA39ITB4_9AGAR|nr:hypothetical protein EV421DRAFT_1913374 [Armillaria borealis]
MTDLKPTTTLVWESPKYQAARYTRFDGEHFEVMQEPGQITILKVRNLGARNTLGTLSSAALNADNLIQIPIPQSSAVCHCSGAAAANKVKIQ